MMTRQIWAAMLAKLVSPMEPERGAKAISAMVPMLTLPAEAFTEESVRAVAQTARQFAPGEYGPLTRVPTFGELETALGRWWWAKRERDGLMNGPVMIARGRPPAPVNPSPEVWAEVSAVVGAFVAERRQQNTPAKRPKPRPYHLTETQLSTVYQQLNIRNPRYAKEPV